MTNEEIGYALAWYEGVFDEYARFARRLPSAFPKRRADTQINTAVIVFKVLFRGKLGPVPGVVALPPDGSDYFIDAHVMATKRRGQVAND